jgi:hypothetical protein
LAPLAFAAKRRTRRMELKGGAEGLRKRKQQKEGAEGGTKAEGRNKRKEQKE